MSDLRGIRADHGRSYNELEAIAGSIRGQLGLDLTRPFPARDVFERLCEAPRLIGQRCIRLQQEIEELPDGVEGTTRYDGGRGELLICLAPATYDDLERRKPRASFVVAHELGHAFLHLSELVRLSELQHLAPGLHLRSKSHEVYCDTEWQANGLAGALLMPAEAMAALPTANGALSRRLVQERFGVSDQAAGYRINVLMSKFAHLLCKG